MLPEDRFFQTLNKEAVWQRYCGFLDLSMEEFMEIQRRLLLEQIELVANSPLYRIITQRKKPQSVEEFRKVVPLTTYDNYEPYIGNCQEVEGGEDTFCPGCQKPIIRRYGYRTTTPEMDEGKCRHCEREIAGVWSA